jgi:hypothetical protein
MDDDLFMRWLTVGMELEEWETDRRGLVGQE